MERYVFKLTKLFCKCTSTAHCDAAICRETDMQYEQIPIKTYALSLTSHKRKRS